MRDRLRQFIKVQDAYALIAQPFDYKAIREDSRHEFTRLSKLITRLMDRKCYATALAAVHYFCLEYQAENAEEIALILGLLTEDFYSYLEAIDNTDAEKIKSLLA